MPAYLCTLDRSKGGHTLPRGADAMVVFAADTTTALQACGANSPGDGTAWTVDGTATPIVAATNWVGWTFAVTVHDMGSGVPATFTKVGDATDDTIDEIGAALVTLINASAIDGAAYNSTTQVLTVAAIADNLGASMLSMKITPPGADSSIAALVGTIVHQGIAGAALTVVLPADAAVIPSVPVLLVQA